MNSISICSNNSMYSSGLCVTAYLLIIAVLTGHLISESESPVLWFDRWCWISVASQLKQMKNACYTTRITFNHIKSVGHRQKGFSFFTNWGTNSLVIESRLQSCFETHLSYGCPFFAFPLRERELLPLKKDKDDSRTFIYFTDVKLALLKFHCSRLL